jgi:2-amino-4-hydroxy-6-hydroxymethyldihydropteridine diphosphokinase
MRHARHGPPRAVLAAAVAALSAAGLTIEAVSPAFATLPLGPPQPAYINACLHARTNLGPQAVLALLHAVERAFGRKRRQRWGARVLDLDLVAYGQVVLPARLHWQGAHGLTLPHPRAHLRAFVMIPLCAVAPGWRHPVLGRTARQIVSTIGGKAGVRRYGTLYKRRRSD